MSFGIWAHSLSVAALKQLKLFETIPLSEERISSQNGSTLILAPSSVGKAILALRDSKKDDDLRSCKLTRQTINRLIVRSPCEADNELDCPSTTVYHDVRVCIIVAKQINWPARTRCMPVSVRGPSVTRSRLRFHGWAFNRDNTHISIPRSYIATLCGKKLNHGLS